MEHVDNDLGFLADTVQMLETDGRAMMVQIQTAVASGDAPTIGRVAHTLKGMISNFCSPAVQTLAHDVEKAGKGGDVARAAVASAKLEPALEALIVELVALVRARS